MKGKLLLAVIALSMVSCVPALASGANGRYLLSTNIPDWATLATINCEFQGALDCHWSIAAGVKYNPFKYFCGATSQTHLRQITPSAGVRYWFGGAFDGWYAGVSLLAGEYSVSLPKSDMFFEGFLYGSSVCGGYLLHVSDRFALAFGAGVALAHHNTTFYQGPVCGRRKGGSSGIAVFPSDIVLSLVLNLGR